MNVAVTARVFKNLHIVDNPEFKSASVFFQFRPHDPESHYTESTLHLSGTAEERRHMLREWAHAEGFVLQEVPHA